MDMIARSTALASSSSSSSSFAAAAAAAAARGCRSSARQRHARAHARLENDTQIRHQRRRTRARATNGADEDEFAIFRFTLGIPGFDDEDIPRAVGVLGAVGLCANHAAASASVIASGALERSETIGLGLCIACTLAPELGRRLKGAKGREKAIGEDVDGGASAVFALSEDESSSVKEDCAWATYAILTNTVATGVMFVNARGEVSVVRGTARGRDDGGVDASKTETLRRVARAWTQASETSSASTASSPPSEYFPTRWDIDRVGANTWAFLPPAAEAIAVERAPAGGVLLVWSDAARAFSRKDRAWFAALARKLDVSTSS